MKLFTCESKLIK